MTVGGSGMVRFLGAVSVALCIAAIGPLRVADAQSVEDISAMIGMSAQQMNAALIAAHAREEQAAPQNSGQAPSTNWVRLSLPRNCWQDHSHRKNHELRYPVRRACPDFDQTPPRTL